MSRIPNYKMKIGHDIKSTKVVLFHAVDDDEARKIAEHFDVQNMRVELYKHPEEPFYVLQQGRNLNK